MSAGLRNFTPFHSLSLGHIAVTAQFSCSMLDFKTVSSVSCVRRYNTLEKYVMPLYNTIPFVLYDWGVRCADRPILPVYRMVTNEKPLQGVGYDEKMKFEKYNIFTKHYTQ